LRVRVCKSEYECCHRRRVSWGMGSSLVEVSLLEVSPGMKVVAWRKPPAVTWRDLSATEMRFCSSGFWTASVNGRQKIESTNFTII
jgi:hypothetical protein